MTAEKQSMPDAPPVLIPEILPPSLLTSLSADQENLKNKFQNLSLPQKDKFTETVNQYLREKKIPEWTDGNILTLISQINTPSIPQSAPDMTDKIQEWINLCDKLNTAITQAEGAIQTGPTPPQAATSNSPEQQVQTVDIKAILETTKLEDYQSTDPVESGIKNFIDGIKKEYEGNPLMTVMSSLILSWLKSLKLDFLTTAVNNIEENQEIETHYQTLLTFLGEKNFMLKEIHDPESSDNPNQLSRNHMKIIWRKYKEEKAKSENNQLDFATFLSNKYNALKPTPRAGSVITLAEFLKTDQASLDKQMQALKLEENEAESLLKAKLQEKPLQELLPVAYDGNLTNLTEKVDIDQIAQAEFDKKTKALNISDEEKNKFKTKLDEFKTTIEQSVKDVAVQVFLEKLNKTTPPSTIQATELKIESATEFTIERTVKDNPVIITATYDPSTTSWSLKKGEKDSITNIENGKLPEEIAKLLTSTAQQTPAQTPAAATGATGAGVTEKPSTPNPYANSSLEQLTQLRRQGAGNTRQTETAPPPPTNTPKIETSDNKDAQTKAKELLGINNDNLKITVGQRGFIIKDENDKSLTIITELINDTNHNKWRILNAEGDYKTEFIYVKTIDELKSRINPKTGKVK